MIVQQVIIELTYSRAKQVHINSKVHVKKVPTYLSLWLEFDIYLSLSSCSTRHAPALNQVVDFRPVGLSKVRILVNIRISKTRETEILIMGNVPRMFWRIT